MNNCNQCGKCCIRYGGGQLSATKEEISHWEQFHPEIFDYVSDGEIWIDPQSGSLLQRCPWLRADADNGKYTCDIYFTRPDDCKQYPSLIDEMIRDACEMLEPKDLKNRKNAEIALEQIMVDSRG